MGRALRTTLLMGVVAAAAVAVAAAIYPWPETVSINERIGQKLFPDFDERKVSNLKVVKINEDQRVLETLRINKKKDAWTIPSASNYAVGNVSRIAAIIDALSERKILNVASEDDAAHSKFGVLDPESPISNERFSGIGQKVTASDNNGRPLVDLIIGGSVRDAPTQHYVRVQSQPTVYVIDFDENILSTRITDWIDPNLMKLATPNSQGKMFSSVIIDDYVIDEDKIDDADSKRLVNYRATLNRGEKEVTLDSLLIEKDGELVPSDEKKKPSTTALQALVTNLTFVPFSNVLTKPEAVAKKLRSSEGKDLKASQFKSMLPFGFRWLECKDGQHKFDSANGQVTVTTQDGIRFTLYIGSLTESKDELVQDLQYHMIVQAAVNLDQFPMPEAVGDDATEEQKRSYSREVRRRELNIDNVQQAVDEYNQDFANWYFVISERIVEAIRPDIEALTE